MAMPRNLCTRAARALAGKAVLVNKAGGVSVLEYVAGFAFPPPKEREVVVKNVSTSVNPVDAMVRKGLFGPLPRTPTILGGDVAGLVVESPKGSKFKAGDKVYGLKPTFPPQADGLGTYAEYVNVKEDWLARVPDNLPLATAGGVPLVALTAWQALHGADPKPGQRILIYAASGSVGHFAVQFAKALGLYVVGTAGAKNLELVKSFGADEAVDYAGGEEALRSRFAGGPDTKFDILLDLIGGRMLEFGAGELLRPGGAVAHVQTTGSDPAANERHAAAAKAGGPRWRVTFVQPNGEQLAKISGLIAEGRVRLNVAHTLPLAEVGKGHEIVEGKHAGGKIVITI